MLYFFLFLFLFLFNSQKTHPEVTVDLNGANVGNGQYVSGRKHVLLISTQLGYDFALQCDTANSAIHWAKTIQQTIKNLVSKVMLIKFYSFLITYYDYCSHRKANQWNYDIFFSAYGNRGSRIKILRPVGWMSRGEERWHWYEQV